MDQGVLEGEERGRGGRGTEVRRRQQGVVARERRGGVQQLQQVSDELWRGFRHESGKEGGRRELEGGIMTEDNTFSKWVGRGCC